MGEDENVMGLSMSQEDDPHATLVHNALVQRPHQLLWWRKPPVVSGTRARLFSRCVYWRCA